MAETHEPSYYEIALTNRQVVVAFVILLTCLVAAFFSGVWIGREATARAAQEQIVRNTPPPQDAEGKNLEELEFFDPKAKKDHKDHKKEAAGEDSSTRRDAVEKPVPGASSPLQAAPAQTPPKKATLADELAGRRTGTATRPQPAAAAAETPPAPAPAAKRAVPAPAPAAADEEAEEAPVPAPKKTAKAHDKTAAASAGAAAGKGAYVIQVFSSPDKAQADRIRAKLAGGGQKAFLSPIERGGRTMYRVRVGPFKSHDDAQKVADKVRKAYRLDTWVTE